MTLACFKRCFQVVFPNLVCFRVRFHTINLKKKHTSKQKIKKIRKLKSAKKDLKQKQKLPFLSPNFLVAQNIPIQHTISGRDLQRRARTHTGFGDPSNFLFKVTISREHIKKKGTHHLRKEQKKSH